MPSCPAARSRFSLIRLLLLVAEFSTHGFSFTAIELSSYKNRYKSPVVSLRSTKSAAFSATPQNNVSRKDNDLASTSNNAPVVGRSLYDVLGTDPNASMDELKAKYKALARVQHPDADGDTDAFIEIAAAYQLLKDPVKRRQYDRSLKAASLSNSISQFVNETSLVPNAVSLLEDIAFPFLRKTTATTLAGMQAATSKSTKNRQGGAAWWQRVLHAATTASRSVDVMELQEKAAILEEQAVSEYEAAVALQQTIQQVVRQRLHFAVATPGTIITSAEAKLLDESVNVSQLQAVESDWTVILNTEEETSAKLRATTQARIQAESAVLRAEQRKIEAQQAYERAMMEAQNKAMELEMVVAAENQAKVAAQKSTMEVERFRQIITEQSELVRTALIQTVQPRVAANATAVAELQSTAIELANAASQMERQAAKLLSRSNELKRRAVVLEKMNARSAKAIVQS